MRLRHDGRGESARFVRHWTIWRRFNEAAPRWARRVVCDSVLPWWQDAASMRPRHDGRGEDVQREDLALGPLLQ